MRELLLLAVHLFVTLAKLARPGGVRSVIAESLLLTHQLIVSGRSRRRAPPLTTIDRFVLGLMALFVRPRRVAKLAAILKPATLLRFHKALVDRKYRRLFSSAGTRRKPGPKGPTEEIVAAILEMKLRNPRFGNQRIAEQISHAFAVQIDKDVVRRVLAKRYGSNHPGASGPSWLTFFAQAKDSLWSVDLFRCESILLRSHWVLVVIDVCTRRIVGFGIGGEYHRRSGCVPHVQSCHRRSRATGADQHRSRPTVPLSPVARQSTDPRGRGDQVSAPCPDVAPIRGTTDRDHPARISRPHALLEFDRSSAEARQIPNLLQRSSRAPLPRRSHASESCREILHHRRQAWRTMTGKAIAMDFSKLPSPLDWEFASHKSK